MIADRAPPGRLGVDQVHRMNTPTPSRYAWAMGRFAALAFVVAWTACTAPGGEGRLRLLVSGAPAVETSSTTSDGWTLQFTHAVAVFSDVVSRGDEPGAEARDGRSVAVDLVPSGPHVLSDVPATASRYPTVDVGLAPAVSTTVSTNVPAELLTAMATARSALYLEGTLTRGATIKSFAWDIPLQSRFVGCGLNLNVTAGASSSARLLFHAQRAFAEGLAATSTRLRADPVANADVDLDGTVTWTEVAAVSGAAFDALDPPLAAATSTVQALDQFVVAALSDALHSAVDQACTSVTRSAPVFPDGGIP